MRALPWAMMLSLCLVAAARDLELLRGDFRQASYACARIDPRRLKVDLACFGRQGQNWTPAYASLGQLPRVRAALNGTFFSLQYHQPAGILVYDQGRQEWQPRFSRPYGDRTVEVYRLHRWYLAIFLDGRMRIGDSRGQGVHEVRSALETEGSLGCLVGGCGLLVSGGQRAVGPDSLAQEGFDERSGLRPEAALPRSAVGLDGQGNLLMLAGGYAGPGLSLADTADLLISLGAREGLFLDCGSSTQFEAEGCKVDSGRALPTWLVAEEP